jgi:HSP20 family protein
MSLVRFDPFRDIAVLQDRVNRVFGELARRNGEDDLMSGGAWVPPVDIFETDNHTLVLKAEMPGLNREDINLKIENNTLTLTGEKHFEKDIKENQFHRVERSFGRFTRTFTLPMTVDTGRIGAEYKNGVLTVTLPLREEAKPKQIEVAVH